jgi:hypothetical protein
MAWPTTFANLAGGTQSLALFDAMFAQVAQMVAIPTNATGVNALTLSPIGNAPTLTAYQNFSSFRFVAGATTSGVVTAQYQSLPALPVYLADGATQVTSGNITGGQEYLLVFIQSLNSTNGGFILENAASPAVVPVAGGVITNLVVNTASTTTVSATWDEIVMNNATGGAIRTTGGSYTCNFGNIGVVNGLDAGALAINTWYALWAISTGSLTGTLGSTSFTAPTLPTGYTFKKRIGAILTDGSSHFYNILQNQRDAQYQIQSSGNTVIIPNIANGVAGTYSTTSPVASSAVSLAGFVPPTATAITVTSTYSYKNGSSSGVLIAPNANWFGTNQGPAGTAGNVWATWQSGVAVQFPTPMLLEALSLRWAASASGGAISCLGWRDNI